MWDTLHWKFIIIIIIILLVVFFCHTLTWISHGFQYVPHPDPPSRIPLHPLPLGLPSAPALSTCLIQPGLAICFTLDSILVSMLFSQNIHPRLLPQSLKVCSVYLCLFFCFAYRPIQYTNAYIWNLKIWKFSINIKFLKILS